MNFLAHISGRGNIHIVGGDEASFKQYLGHYLVGASIHGGETTVYIGQLPPTEATKFEVPIPDSVHVIGSTVRDNILSDVLLNTDATAEDAMTTYDQLLLAAGWRFIEDMRFQLGGFANKELPVPRRYCKVYLTLTVSVGKIENTTALRLSINQDTHPCRPVMMHHVDHFMPTLETPLGVRLVGSNASGGSGGLGGNYFLLFASVTTDMPVSELARSYHDQLNAFNWQLLSETINDNSILSIWQVLREDIMWTAYFTIAARPHSSGEYMMWLNGYEQLPDQ